MSTPICTLRDNEEDGQLLEIVREIQKAAGFSTLQATGRELLKTAVYMFVRDEIPVPTLLQCNIERAAETVKALLGADAWAVLSTDSITLIPSGAGDDSAEDEGVDEVDEVDEDE